MNFSALLRFAAVSVFAVLLASCRSVPAPTEDVKAGARQNWIERRAAQIVATGVNSSVATPTASHEWWALTEKEQKAIFAAFAKGQPVEPKAPVVKPTKTKAKAKK